MTTFTNVGSFGPVSFTLPSQAGDVRANRPILVQVMRGEKVAYFLCDYVKEDFKRKVSRDGNVAYVDPSGFIEFSLTFTPLFLKGETLNDVLTFNGGPGNSCCIFIDGRVVVSNFFLTSFITGQDRLITISGEGKGR